MAPFTRRIFLTKTAIGIAGVGLSKLSWGNVNSGEKGNPVVISNWKYGQKANEAVWNFLSEGGYSLDAVEVGVRIAESDSCVTTAGKGDSPDTIGKVRLDASIMNEKGDTGSVVFLQNIKHPVSVARLVMEKTPNVILCGDEALKFALENGYKEKLLTKEMRKCWKKWKKEEPEHNAISNNEKQLAKFQSTISMLALDENGHLCGASTARGLAHKMHGTIGDSPMIGAGLFIDGEIGGAAATGAGELVMKTMGSFLVVEFMRSGMSPEEACNAAIARIVKKNPGSKIQQVGYIAINKAGETGAASLQSGFSYTLKSPNKSELKEADSWYKKL